MTKKIEITSAIATASINDTLNNFKGNSQSVNGPLQMYLMSGDVPIDENGYFPKNFSVTYTKVGDNIGSPDFEMPIIDMTAGTYIATVTGYGQSITAAIDVSNGISSNFRITARTGSNGFGTGNPITFPFQIPITYTNTLGYEPQDIAMSIDLNAQIDWSGTTLVNWKNNRVIISDNSISTYAAVATSSGTATWFYAYNNGTYIVGTVGTTGSGADLELDSVSIVQGKTYGISNLRIQMPTSFTY